MMKLMLRRGEKESGHRTVSVKNANARNGIIFPIALLLFDSYSLSPFYTDGRNNMNCVTTVGQNGRERKQLSLYGCGTGYPKILFFPSLQPLSLFCLSLKSGA